MYPSHPLCIIPWERSSVDFQHKYPKYYSKINFLFRHKYRKSYSSINLYWRREEAEAQSAVKHARVCSRKNLYFPFCKLYILGQSTVLRFQVVKSFIAANCDQLRISFIILQTIHFFLQKLVKFQIFVGQRGSWLQWHQC